LKSLDFTTLKELIVKQMFSLGQDSMKIYARIPAEFHNSFRMFKFDL